MILYFVLSSLKNDRDTAHIYVYVYLYKKIYNANEEIFNVNSLHKYFLGNDCFQFSISFILKSSNHIIMFFFLLILLVYHFVVSLSL